MTKLFIVLALLAAVITAAALEQHFIQGAYKYMERETNALIELIEPESVTKVDEPEFIERINAMYDYWIKAERRLSMLARHFDLAQLSTNIIYAKNFIEFDNKEEAMVGLLQMRYLIKTHSFNVGTSIQNVI